MTLNNWSATPTMMPKDLWDESFTQRQTEADRLRREADDLFREPVHTRPIRFNQDSPLFEKAKSVAVELDENGRCSDFGVESVCLRPYPSKSPGFWRIEVRYATQRAFTGSEWYVHESKLFAAWESHG